MLFLKNSKSKLDLYKLLKLRKYTRIYGISAPSRATTLANYWFKSRYD